MKKTSPILYLHGGPGMSSIAENQLFQPFLLNNRIDAIFWNEPSKSRPSGDLFTPEHAFSNWMNSARKKAVEVFQEKGPLHLVAHSFAAIPSLLIAREHPQMISQLTWIAPAFSLYFSFKTILQLCHSDFQKTDPESAKALQLCINNSKKFFDGPMQEGLLLASKNAFLFTHYWQQTSAMIQFFECLKESGSIMDFESFFSVCLDLSQKLDSIDLESPLDCPTQLVLGKNDLIIDNQNIIQIVSKLAPQTKISIFENSKHYPHLEEIEQFFKVLT